MNYVITYCKDTKAFMDELPDSYKIKDMDGVVTGWSIQTTPVIKNENGSLAMSILTDEELAFIGTMKSIRSLGTHEELFANDEALALYKSVYPYDVPLSYVDMDGTTKQYFRPQKIGEFALQ
jgi:hypothetical protein